MRNDCMNKISIHKDESFIPNLTNSIERQEHRSSWELFQLAYHYKRSTMMTSFDTLQALDHLPQTDFLEHQINAAKTVIQEMNGRAILADEVGLGKTIEAGLILKEYMIRGLVKNALILVPASLINQWIKELQEKFYIPLANYRKNYQWDDYPFFITSLDLAKRMPHRTEISKMHFDMVIIDEAHRLKNANTLNHQFVQSIQKKYCLFLTATPIQNNLLEIFNLVTILKPGYLGDYESFVKKYHKNNKQHLQNAYLQKLIKKVMIRNRRKDTLLDNVKRHVHTIWLQFTEEEQAVYKQLENTFHGLSSLSKMTYLKELCSSREACYLSLQKTTNNDILNVQTDLLDMIAALPHHVKAKKLIEMIEQIGQEKIIVFTEYRATQYYLQWYLHQHQISSVSFQGGLKKGRKEWITQLFEQDKQVLIATEAGGEGINLQFCHHIINYDLPWNPMRLEQRIGRIHRYGQKNNMHIYNFAIEQTMEEHIVKLLYDKLHIFENVIGKLDKILASLQINNMEDQVMQIMEETTSAGELRIKMDNFVSVVQQMNDTIGEQQDGS